MRQSAGHFHIKKLNYLMAGLFAIGMSASAQAQQESVQSLQNVVVTASGFDQDIREAPASISVITRQDLEEKPFTDLADALRNMEGVDVRGATGKTGNLNISIRGMPSEYTLILIDGRRQNAAGDVMPNGFGDAATGFMPPLSAIERIEVIRGPMSTLYGSDAMGGVVNIITRKVANEWGGTLTMETNVPQNSDVGALYKGSAYITGPIVEDLLGVAISGSLQRRASSDLTFGNGDEVSKRGPSPVESRAHSVGAKFTLTPTKDHDIWLDLKQDKQWFNNDECQLGDVDGVCGRGVAGYKDHLRFNREQAAIGSTSRFNLGTLDLSLMRNETKTLGRTIPTAARPLGDPSVGMDRDLKATNTVFDTKFVAPLGENHMLTVGGQYWQGKMLDGVVNETFKQDTYALFAEDEWYLTDTLTATVGLRYDHHEAFGNNYSPRGYLVWTPTEQWTVKGGVSRGYKTPNLEQLHSGVSGISGQGTTISVGNPNLQPEVSTSSELGFNFDSLQGWTLGVTGFHTRIKDKITAGGQCGTNYIASCAGVTNDATYRINRDKAITQGLEFTGGIDFNEAWSLRLNYTYTDTELKANGRDDGPLGDTPKHMANATLRWDTSEKLNFWLQGEYRGSSHRFDGLKSNLTGNAKREYEAVGDLKGYTLFNLGSSYEVSKNVRLNAAIYNLFDKDFLDCKTWTNETGDVNCASPYVQSGRATKGTIPSYGRAFWLSANISF